MPVQLGQILDNKIQKDQKNPQLPLLKRQEQKQGVGSKSRVLRMPPALSTTRRVGRPPQPPLWLTPGHTLPSPHIRNQLAPHSGSK